MHGGCTEEEKQKEEEKRKWEEDMGRAEAVVAAETLSRAAKKGKG